MSKLEELKADYYAARATAWKAVFDAADAAAYNAVDDAADTARTAYVAYRKELERCQNLKN
jgi:hypothetical protein